MNTAQPCIAIVGSGPSACYSAQMLRKHWKEAQIVLIDRLPVPYGLVRYGVAPDHQGTKAVTAQFARLFERDNIRFLGNLEIGRDLALTDLRSAFDVVLLASGLAGDRSLGIPGEDLPQVYGAGRLTRHINAHPDETDFVAEFGERCLIIGGGNVAIDVLRLLIKPAHDWQGSDLHPHLHDKGLLNSPPTQLAMVVRSTAAAAKFDPLMLRELGKIQGVAFQMEGMLDNPEDARVRALAELCSLHPANPRCTVTFYFGWQPEAIIGRSRVEAMRFTRADGQTLHLQADSLISAIGFTEHPSSLCRETLMTEQSNLERGLLDNGLFCVGWFRRGPTGTIAENRQDAKQVSQAIIAEVERGALPCAKAGVAALPEDLLKNCTDYSGWQRIDTEEKQCAPAGRVRQKITERVQMLAVAGISPQGEQP
ncbi:hypothetical protein AXE65_03885 [Ventosimonas gracilis]|uniref:FAD/NAD(P)-binding domain-containing protein n=1 Tax=Ventosimonas gracilis TaxID=1680762 RepID=A0A139SRD6_9GAMM|nr:FAD-dependent oxidoreductase [Ventosimonas gracilis]KXU37165.1 hypothetical protein AXE65_03885 [Ventosimonas gracilis]